MWWGLSETGIASNLSINDILFVLLMLVNLSYYNNLLHFFAATCKVLLARSQNQIGLFICIGIIYYIGILFRTQCLQILGIEITSLGNKFKM